MKTTTCLITLFLLFLMTNISGQSEKTKRFGISLSSGFSIPTGAYSKKDPENSAVYIDKAFPLSIQGFERAKSGFAEIGVDYNFEITYKIASSLKLLLRTGKFSNSIETYSMSKFVTHVYSDLEMIVYEDGYRFLYITPGISYLYAKNNFDFGADLTMGYSVTDYPYYTFVQFFTTDNPTVLLDHYGPQPNLGAFTIGSSLFANYKIFDQFKVGFILSYQRSNFKYNLFLRSWPDHWGTFFYYSDILKVRVLQPEFKISYNF